MIAKRIAKNFIALFAGNVVSQAIVFFTIIKIARLLPSAEFGLFSFAQAIANYFARTTEFGLETIAVRRISKNENSSSLLENVVAFRLVFTVIILALIYVFCIVTFQFNGNVVLLILIFSLFGVSLSPEWYYQAYEKMQMMSLIRITRSLFFLFPIIMVSSALSTAYDISFLYSISFILSSILFFIFVVLKSGFHVSEIKISKIRGLIKESYPIGISGMLMQIPFYFNIFIIGLAMDKSDVGMYSAAYRPVLAFWSFGIMAMYNSFFPVMNSVSNNIESFEKYLRTLTKIFIVLSVIMGLSLIPMGPSILSVLYSDKYNDASYIFQLSLIVVGIVLSRTGIEYSLVSLNRQKEYLHGIIMVSFLYIILSTIAVLMYGILGVIIASIVAEVAYTLYLLYQIKKILQTNHYTILFSKSVIIVIMLAILSIFVPITNMGISITILIVIFVLGVWLLQIITKDEIFEIYRSLTKGTHP